MEAVSRFELFVAGSSEMRVSQGSADLTYQIKATIAAGVPVFESWKRVSKFRTGGELAAPHCLYCILPESSDLMLLVSW